MKALTELQNPIEFPKFETANRFRALAESFCDHAKSIGIEILPYQNPALLHCRKLTPEQQTQALSRLTVYYKIMSTATEAKIELRDDKSLLWWALKEFKLRPTSDILDKLDEGDVIEVYDSNFVQIYRNFQFFRICSYTLEELFSYEWPVLFDREAHITESLIKDCMKVLSSPERKTIRFEVADHIIRENFSPKKFHIKAVHKVISPLFDTVGQVAAFVGFSAASVISQNTN
jgi:hypothetical protein